MKATINSKQKMFREKNGVVSQFCKSLHCLAEEKSAGFSQPLLQSVCCDIIYHVPFGKFHCAFAKE